MNKNNKSSKSKLKRSNTSKDEIKFVDVSATTYITTSSGTVINLNPIVQGNTYNQRVGNDVTVTNIDIKLYMYQLFSGGVILSNARVVFFVDTQQVASTVPAVTDVIFPASPIAFKNYPNRRRFRILKDIQIPLDVYKPHRYVEMTIPLQGLLCSWSTNSGIDWNKNGVYMLIISDGSILSAPILDYNCRLKFTDD